MMDLKLKQWLPLLISGVLLSAALLSNGLSRPARQTSATVDEATADEAPRVMEPMRGVWVTYMDLSMEYEEDKSEAAFRKKTEGIVELCADRGFNTLIVQVRPFCDALYRSELFPASHVLSGKQGKYPGYDALDIICALCREHRLSVQAWVNPYRVTADDVPEKLSESNPSVTDPELCLTTESGTILDPSNEKARKLIADGVREIVEGYDVDGVQFDDYFYPPEIADEDREQYKSYADNAEGKVMPLEEWRRQNVNLMLAQVYMTVHEAKPDAVFGISPQGNLGNNAALYADPASWCSVKGYADYICPQLYFSPDNPYLGFYDALDEWLALDLAEGVRLYAGLAGYKAGSGDDEGTWLDRDDILAEEYRAVRDNEKLGGFMLYGYASLTDEKAADEIKKLTEEFDQASSPTQ